MNNKTILFKVAQHPLIKMMLKESIVAPSVLARLIVEEMVEEAQSRLLIEKCSWGFPKRSEPR